MRRTDSRARTWNFIGMTVSGQASSMSTMLHYCTYDRKVSLFPELAHGIV